VDPRDPDLDPNASTPARRQRWWWLCRERVLDPLWHAMISAFLPGAWVPPLWGLSPARRSRRRPQ
jgi:hypothetical protein